MKNKTIIVLVIVLSLLATFFILTINKEKGELIELNYKFKIFLHKL